MLFRAEDTSRANYRSLFEYAVGDEARLAQDRRLAYYEQVLPEMLARVKGLPLMYQTYSKRWSPEDNRPQFIVKRLVPNEDGDKIDIVMESDQDIADFMARKGRFKGQHGFNKGFSYLAPIYHVERDEMPFIQVDLDIDQADFGKQAWSRLLEAVEQVYNWFRENGYDALINFTGSSFHVWAKDGQVRTYAETKQVLKALSEATGLPLAAGAAHVAGQITIDYPQNKYRAPLRFPLSIHGDTGLVSIIIPRNQLRRFDPLKRAHPDEVLKQLPKELARIDAWFSDLSTTTTKQVEETFSAESRKMKELKNRIRIQLATLDEPLPDLDYNTDLAGRDNPRRLFYESVRDNYGKTRYVPSIRQIGLATRQVEREMSAESQSSAVDIIQRRLDELSDADKERCIWGDCGILADQLMKALQQAGHTEAVYEIGLAYIHPFEDYESKDFIGGHVVVTVDGESYDAYGAGAKERWVEGPVIQDILAESGFVELGPLLSAHLTVNWTTSTWDEIRESRSNLFSGQDVSAALDNWTLSKEAETEYKKKRQKPTPEPGVEGGTDLKPSRLKPPMKVKDSNVYSVQKHQAKKAGSHRDIRIGLDGVLLSFVPVGGTFGKSRIPRKIAKSQGKGFPEPSVTVVKTEDHPFDYWWFEGEIPEGSYGAGPVTLETYGTRRIIEWKPDKRLKVEFIGGKYAGTYTFQKIGKSDNLWRMWRSRPVPENKTDKKTKKAEISDDGYCSECDEHWSDIGKHPAIDGYEWSEESVQKALDRNSPEECWNCYALFTNLEDEEDEFDYYTNMFTQDVVDAQIVKKYIDSIHDGYFAWWDDLDDLEFTLQKVPLTIWDNIERSEVDGQWIDAPVYSHRLSDTLQQFRNQHPDDDYPPVVLALNNSGNYEVIDGFHRLNALQILGEESVMAWVGTPVVNKKTKKAEITDNKYSKLNFTRAFSNWNVNSNNRNYSPATRYIENLLEEAQYMQGKIILYRAIRLANPEDFDPTETGESWTPNINFAEPYFGYNNYSKKHPNYYTIYETYILMALVPVESVDWNESVARALEFGPPSDEKEIVLKRGAPIELINLPMELSFAIDATPEALIRAAEENERFVDESGKTWELRRPGGWVWVELEESRETFIKAFAEWSEKFQAGELPLVAGGWGFYHNRNQDEPSFKLDSRRMISDAFDLEPGPNGWSRHYGEWIYDSISALGVRAAKNHMQEFWNQYWQGYFAQDEEVQKQVDEVNRHYIENAIQYVENLLMGAEYAQGKIKLYRAITLINPEDFDPTNTGQSWTPVKSAATPYFSHMRFHSRNLEIPYSLKMQESNTYILTALVPVESVDWYTTVLRALVFEDGDEKEIVLKTGAPIELVDVPLDLSFAIDATPEALIRAAEEGDGGKSEFERKYLAKVREYEQSEEWYDAVLEMSQIGDESFDYALEGRLESLFPDLELPLSQKDYEELKSANPELVDEERAVARGISDDMLDRVYAMLFARQGSYENYLVSWSKAHEAEYRDGKILLYREITMNSPAELDTARAGIYWTPVLQAAEAHWGGGGEHFLLRALVDFEDINWKSSWYGNLIHPEECEIRLLEGAKIELLPLTRPPSRYGRNRQVGEYVYPEEIVFEIEAPNPNLLAVERGTETELLEAIEDLPEEYRRLIGIYPAEPQPTRTGFASEQDEVVLYHGTATANVESILQEGLRPDYGWAMDSFQKGVFLATHPSSAAPWARWSAMRALAPDSQIASEGETSKFYQLMARLRMEEADAVTILEVRIPKNSYQDLYCDYADLLDSGIELTYEREARSNEDYDWTFADDEELVKSWEECLRNGINLVYEGGRIPPEWISVLPWQSDWKSNYWFERITDMISERGEDYFDAEDIDLTVGEAFDTALAEIRADVEAVQPRSKDLSEVTLEDYQKTKQVYQRFMIPTGITGDIIRDEWHYESEPIYLWSDLFTLPAGAEEEWQQKIDVGTTIHERDILASDEINYAFYWFAVVQINSIYNMLLSRLGERKMYTGVYAGPPVELPDIIESQRDETEVKIYRWLATSQDDKPVRRLRNRMRPVDLNYYGGYPPTFYRAVAQKGLQALSYGPCWSLSPDAYTRTDMWRSAQEEVIRKEKKETGKKFSPFHSSERFHDEVQTYVIEKFIPASALDWYSTLISCALWYDSPEYEVIPKRGVFLSEES